MKKRVVSEGKSVLGLLLLFLWLVSASANADILFEEVTSESGINYTGRSWGGSWGDFNGDGWVDLWVSNHGEIPSLYINNGDGTFSDRMSEIFSEALASDKHGAAWADFDNDGDQDLIQTVGASSGSGSGPNWMLVNENGIFTEQATHLGLDYSFGRGRTPLWLDWNLDGYLDIFLVNWKRDNAPSVLFLQDYGLFINATESGEGLVNGLNLSGQNTFAQASHLKGDSTSYLIVNKLFGGNPDLVAPFNSDTITNEKIEIGWPSSTWVQDMAIEDFNGDILPDVFIVRARDVSEVLQTDSNIIKMAHQLNNREEGVEFAGGGDISLEFHPSWNVQPEDIFIGADGINPTSRFFTLQKTDPDVLGIQDHETGVDAGVFVGFDETNQKWKILISASAWVGINVLVTGTEEISNVSTVGLNPEGWSFISDELFIQTADGFINNTAAAGLDTPTSCGSVVAYDFDNDMDIDIYQVCRGMIANYTNVLYENDGTGNFQAVPQTGGAEGSMLGRGESVAVADYNNDGFLDLFVTNGDGADPFADGPSQLYRNIPNQNNWIHIDLEGTVSNRDGTGSLVLVTAGGVTQMRERNGGMHRYVQNHQRLHFGLAQNAFIEKIEVYWPSGIVQTLKDINVNQILRIVESGVSAGMPTPIPSVSATPTPQISPTLEPTPTPVATPTPDVNLIAYYAFEEGSGSIAVDSSGNGNDGTINGGASRTVGANGIGTGLEFNGVDAYVDIGDIDLTDAFTIAAWIKPSTLGIKGVVTGKTFQTYQLFISPQNNIMFQSNSDTQFAYNANLTVDTWYHVAVTFDTVNGMVLYVNGNAVAVNSTNQILNTNNAVTKIGATHFTPKDFFAGTIDEVRIYDRALAVNEVQVLLNVEGTTPTPTPSVSATPTPLASPSPEPTASPSVSPTPTSPPELNLLAYYAFEEGSGSIAVDSSGNGNNGSINGGAAWTTGANGTGGGLEFNGIDSYVDIGDIDLTDAFTIAAWIKPSTLGIKGVVIGKTFQTYQLFISPQNDIVFQSNSGTQFVYNASLTLDTWYHVAVTFNTADGMVLYVNGNAVAVNSTNQILNTNDVVTKIGATHFTPKDFFAGTIDEVRIYDRALTANEIQVLLNVE